jgi:hypothetical protein
MAKKKRTARYNPQKPSESYDSLDYQALRQSSAVATIAQTEGYHFDSVDDASMFFARDLDFIKAQAYERQYPEFNATRIFPVSSSVDPGAETIVYHIYDKVGFAKIISDYSQDLPRTNATAKEYSAKIKSVGDSFDYSVQDLRRSRYTGKSLDVKRAEAAKRAVDQEINRIAWCGDEEYGLLGVLSADNQVPVWTPPTNAAGTSTKFADKTPDEILATFKGALSYMSATTKGVERPDTIALDEGSYIELSTTPRSDSSDVTILSWLEDNLPDITFERVGELCAGTEYNPFGNENVMVIYKNDPSKLEIEIPMPFMQHPAQPKSLVFEIPCEARVAGALIAFPFSLLIVPGV